MDYWGNQIAIVCELCGGWHDTHQCANFQSQQHPFSNTYQPDIINHPIFSWDNNQYGMQQSHMPSSPYQNQQYGAGPYDPSQMQQSAYPSYPLQNQQFGTEPYTPWEIQQQQGQQFEHQYAPWQQQFQPVEFQEQPFHISYGQQSNEEAELEELRWMCTSQAESLKALQNQIDQITNASLNSPQRALSSDTGDLEAEQEDKNIHINLDWPFLATSVPLIDVQQEELTMKVHDQFATSNVLEAIQIPLEDEDCCSVGMVDTGQSEEVDQPLKTNSEESAFREKSDFETEEVEEHVQSLNAAPLQSKLDTPHEALGLEDLWNSQVRLKPSSEEAPKLELKSVPDHWGYTYLGESYTIPVITAANLSEIEEDKLLRVLRECNSTIGWSKPVVELPRRPYPIIKEVEKEEILKWPMDFDMKAVREKKLLQLSELDEFRHQAYENSRLYKEQLRKWLDKQLAYKALHPP